MILYKVKNIEKGVMFVSVEESYWQPVYPRWKGSFGTIITNDRDWIKNESKYHDGNYSSWLTKLMNTYNVKQSGTDYDAMHRDMREMVEKAKEKGHILIPISTYNHSGTSVYAGLPYDHFDGKWDCSFHGFILANKTQIKKEFKVKEITENYYELAKEHLLEEIRELDNYVSGEWCQLMYYDKNGEIVDEQVVNSNDFHNILGEQIGEFNCSSEVESFLSESQV